MKEIIVVESGAKTKTIRRFLRGGYDVIACGGHIVDLPDGELGIDVENDFRYRVEPLQWRGEDRVSRLSRRLDGADRVYLATDPDREGEAIAADIQEFCVPPDCETRRIEFNAIVYHEVTEALQSPRGIDEERVEAQRTRRALDRLIGFILSPIAQFEGPRCPAVGRVLAPAVALVVDREGERDRFVPRRHWTLHAALSWQESEFEATFRKEWDEFAEARDLALRVLDAGKMTVTACEEDANHQVNPLPPYTTDALQQEADYRLGFAPERTMRLAQRLYEGVEIRLDAEREGDSGAQAASKNESGGEPRALITYMRTDSTRISGTGMGLARQALAAREDCGEELYKGRPWRSEGGAQDAHEAIRPTAPQDPDVFPENLDGKLDEPLLNLYRLIYFRFLASQMVPAVYHTTKLTLEAAGLTAEAEAHRLKSPGFLTLYRKVRPGHGLPESEVPALPAGTVLEVERSWPWFRDETPPPRYREGSLVGALKERGIGRPSTYGDILEKIKRYGYVRRVGATLQPRKKGKDLCDFLRRHYEHVIDYDYTARMEEGLERIQEGKESYEEYLSEEFRWLRRPYERAREQGWLEGERPPAPAQTDYLKSLAEETGAEVPEEVWDSRKLVSRWIDKLQEERESYLQLTPIEAAESRGQTAYRFWLLAANVDIPGEEHEFLKSRKMKLRSGTRDRPPGYRFQRRDRDTVQELWDELKERYAGRDSPMDAELRLPEDGS